MLNEVFDTVNEGATFRAGTWDAVHDAVRPLEVVFEAVTGFNFANVASLLGDLVLRRYPREPERGHDEVDGAESDC